MDEIHIRETMWRTHVAQLSTMLVPGNHMTMLSMPHVEQFSARLMSMQRFAQAQDRYLVERAEGLRDGSYRPQPVKRVYIPKGSGQRQLGIPAVKDRVVQAALKLVIEPIFEHEFDPRSYGFRQGLGCKDALREVNQYLKAGYFWVVDADLQSYFDTIPHTLLLTKVEQRIVAGAYPTVSQTRHSGRSESVDTDLGEFARGSNQPFARQYLPART